MAFVADQFFPDMDATTLNEWVDFDQFLDLPSGYDDQSTATTVSPQDLALPYEADGIFTSPSDFMQSPFDMTSYDLPQEEFMGMNGGFMQDPAAPLFDDAAFLGYNPYDSSNTFRSLVEAQAAADPRVASIKEKRREAAIALHLQRLCDATALDLDMSSDSNTSFSSPSWSEYVSGSISPRPSPENTSVSEAPPPGGMEMVLDLNMNTAANVPKKQKADDGHSDVPTQANSVQDGAPGVAPSNFNNQEMPFNGFGPMQGMPMMPFSAPGFGNEAMGFMNPMAMASANGFPSGMGPGWNPMNMPFNPLQAGMFDQSNGGMPNGFPNMFNGDPSMMFPMPQNGFQGPNSGMNNFSNQQRTAFSTPYSREEDSPYFRQPVNPQRHQARNRRVRPSDYREL